MDSLQKIPGLCVGCHFFFFFLGQHRVSIDAEPKPWHVESDIMRPNLRHLLSSNFFSFKTAKTEYQILGKYFSITWSQEQAIYEHLKIQSVASHNTDFSSETNLHK